MQDKDLQGNAGNVVQIGEMLAEAFIARLDRFSPADRIKLLKACRKVLAKDADISAIFFHAE